jgi:hypothetical protein
MADKIIQYTEELVGAGHPTKADTLNRGLLVEHNADGTHVDSIKYAELIKNMKPIVNAIVNKLDIFTKSGGATPNATNIISVAIPDGNGYTFRNRAAAYLSGTSQFIMAAAANYWSKGSLDAEMKTAWIYAIWDGTGIVWALSGYSGFNIVPTTTTVTDDDYFLLEAGSTYTRNAAHFCAAIAKIRYQYDTADTPNHTIQATGENAPQVVWNPRSDYGYQKNLATTISSSSTIQDQSIISIVVKQSRKYDLIGVALTIGSASVDNDNQARIKTGKGAYSAAIQKAVSEGYSVQTYVPLPLFARGVYLNSGDTIYLGCQVANPGSQHVIYGDNNFVGATSLSFSAAD